MHYRPRIKTALSPFALLLIILISQSLFGQVTSGTISGFVKDPSGAYVKGASVTAENPTNGLTRTVTTSDSGEFVFPGLYPGTYTIKVEAQGFSKMEKSGFVLSAAGKVGRRRTHALDGSRDGVCQCYSRRRPGAAAIQFRRTFRSHQ